MGDHGMEILRKDLIKAYRFLVLRDDISLLNMSSSYQNFSRDLKELTGISEPIKGSEDLKAFLVMIAKPCSEMPPWEDIRKGKSFRDVKLYLRKSLARDVKARSWAQLEQYYSALRAIFESYQRKLTPEELYAMNNASSFKGSSNLEGITVSGEPKTESKEEIIARILKKRNKG
ncbi:hypothetical protein A1OO_08510 [Enterovibrio norvegicus FF-33]|uniref:hypothetical protein n=1 Tax=Enterovibrio norvegicus TaxID=188144 RepID=UPI00036794E7|nr:hypothetical protein [Enterovibrio norvegicus]OEE65840.1 hypothetical protein A1OO_08510 [Enterovibrio norvegicus FF-33]